SEEIAAAPAIRAILAQSEFSSLQSIGGSYWAPTQNFGELMAAGNPGGRNLQDILDEMVKGITSLY
ncbi:MAG: maltose ABC transporter substrate-binding protein, partial [Lachnospiraceae bacterium]|nr:maltose ABC transporter substrate-binding protein [Lachnospiraceae bacterium]